VEIPLLSPLLTLERLKRLNEPEKFVVEKPTTTALKVSTEVAPAAA
jgi:hypothetical protein